MSECRPCSEVGCPTDTPFGFSITTNYVPPRPPPPTPSGEPCRGCGAALDCADDPAFPYSLTRSPQYPFVENCPAGFNCSDSVTISFDCCGRTLTVQRPAGATAAQLCALFNMLISQCQAFASQCGLKLPPLQNCNPSYNDPAVFRSNAPATARVNCADGYASSQTIPAGAWTGLSAGIAQQNAQGAAQQAAQAHQVCAGGIAGSATIGTAYSQSITATGQPVNNISASPWSVVSGALPPGLTFGPSVLPFFSVPISGTPTTPGTYNFTVQFVAPTGDRVVKPYQISVGATSPPVITLTPTYGAIGVMWTAETTATTYQLSRRVSGVGSFVVVDVTPTLAFNDTMVSPGVSYDYQIQAYNGMIPIGTSAIQTSMALTLGAPTLSASTGAGNVLLNWTAPTGATGYQLYRGTVNGGPWPTLVTSTSATHYTDTGLPSGTYYYVVVATVGAVTSSNSNQQPATLILTAPVLSATSGDASVSMTWTSPTGAISYKLYRGVNNGGPWPTLVASTGATSFVDTGLTNGTNYYYVVQAVAGAVLSGNSNQVNGQPSFFWNINWSNLSVTQGGSFSSYSSTHSFNPSSLSASINAVSHPVSAGNGFVSNDNNANPIIYTGPARACNMHIVFNTLNQESPAGLPLATSIFIDVYQDGNPIASYDIGPGTYSSTTDIHFTIAAGINSRITVVFQTYVQGLTFQGAGKQLNTSATVTFS